MRPVKLLALLAIAACVADPMPSPEKNDDIDRRNPDAGVGASECATTCTGDAQCGEGEFCSGKGCCEDAPNCDRESGCCAGQICSLASGSRVCRDEFVKCTADDACSTRGQVCLPSGSAKLDNGCTFRPCAEDGSCKDALKCFNGWCVGEAPCGGGCAAGGVCTPVNDRCFQVSSEDGWPAGVGESCAQTCGEGTILVFADGANVFHGCDAARRECRCEAVPAFD